MSDSPTVTHLGPYTREDIDRAWAAGEVLTGYCGFQRVPMVPVPPNKAVCPTCAAESRRRSALATE